MPANLSPQTLDLLSKIITARTALEDKPLESPNIIGDLVKKYGAKNPLGQGMQQFMAHILPMALPIGGKLEEAETGEEAITTIPQLLKSLLSSGERGAKTIPVSLEEQQALIAPFGVSPKAPATEMGIPPWDRATTSLPPGGGLTTPIQNLRGGPRMRHMNIDWKKDYEPFSKTSTLTEPPLVSPLKAPTEPIGRIKANDPEGRLHGTRNPIAEMRARGELDSPDNLHGPGLYTTNNQIVGKGYAGIEKMNLGTAGASEEVGGPGSVLYHSHQIAPVRFINGDKPIPPKVAKRIAAIVGEEFAPVASSKYAYPDYHPTMTPRDWVESYMYGQGHRYGIDGWKIFQDAAEAEGYGGLKHRGGGIVGSVPHDVKVYWYPEEQVRLRPGKYSLGTQTKESAEAAAQGKNYPDYLEFRKKHGLDQSPTGAVPRTPRHMGKAPKPKYVPDVFKTKKLTLKDKVDGY